jgi:hypothetical protein
VDEESTFHTLFRRWSRTKLAIGELAQVCLDGSTPSICYANTAKLGRAVEGASPYGLVRRPIVGRGSRAVEGAFPVAVPEKICGLALSLIFSTAATP